MIYVHVIRCFKAMVEVWFQTFSPIIGQMLKIEKVVIHIMKYCCAFYLHNSPCVNFKQQTQSHPITPLSSFSWFT